MNKIEIENFYNKIDTLKVGEEVLTEFGKGKVVSVMLTRGSGWETTIEINGIKHRFSQSHSLGAKF